MSPSLADKRIGFLYNHAEIHQVAHTAPVISALRTHAPEMRVDVLTSSVRQQDAVLSHLDAEQQTPDFRPLEPSRRAKIVEKLLGGVVPLTRISGLSANLDMLARYDVLVVPEVTSTLLKTRFGLTKPKLIFLPHGAGDRSISFAPEIARFDYVLLPGKKTQRRMLEAGVIRSDNHAVIGYPKFDTLRDGVPERFFDNDRPTAIYNPHFDPKLSSWFTFGEKLLDYFAEQDRFNLIFAPHVMLFRRKMLASVEHRKIKIRRPLPERFFDLPHMLFDTGSERSVDMSYTRAADIYVGDVSSQVYEFIERPRPAIFLNSHDADWRNDSNYDFWKFGSVVDTINGFTSALDAALPLDEAYGKAQTDAFADTFSTEPDASAAERAARAIIRFIDGGRGE